MNYFCASYPVLRMQKLSSRAFDMTIGCPDVASAARPGQFVHVKCEGFFLRRPISICEIYKEQGAIRLIFEVRGEGTDKLSKVQKGQAVDLIGPVGNGFDLSLGAGKPVVFVGGGIGTPPLLESSRAFGKDADILLGFRDKDAVLLKEDFERFGCRVEIATDDGSVGHHGLVTELLRKRISAGPCSAVYACGPMPMLKAVAKLAEDALIPCQVSLEERMGCGIGACLVCACETKHEGHKKYAHVCTEGPVFDSREVLL